MKSLCWIAVVTLGCLGWPSGVLRADENPPAEVRRAVETAWLEGRLETLEERLDGADPLVFPLALRDFVWRPEALPIGSAPPAGRALLTAEVESSPRYDPLQPLPAEVDGGQDPYPVLTALIRDRRLRETRGATGLPAQSPLLELARAGALSQRQQDLLYYLEYWMSVVYTGTYPDDPDYEAEQRRVAAVAQGLEERNGFWAVLCLLSFVLAPLGLGAYLGRRSA
jgi:hypothetical protein